MRWPKAIIMLDMPIGPIHDSFIQSYGVDRGTKRYRPNRRRADAIVITPDSLYMIEGKIENTTAGVGSLVTYLPLIPFTPELEAYKNLPVRVVLVIPASAGWVSITAKYHGIEIAEYNPAWLYDYWQHRNDRFTSKHRQERQKRLAVIMREGYTNLA